MVLGVGAEDLVLRPPLGSGQHHRPLTRLVASHRNLRAVDAGLDHHLRALEHGLAYGRCQLVLVLHLGYAEAAPVGCRLHETGHADACLHLVVAHKLLVAAAYEQAVGHEHAVAAQILVEHELVEGHRLDKNAARGVRYSNQVEVSLEHSVLSRRAVNGYVCIIEEHGFTVFHKREVIAVDGGRGAVAEVDVPVEALHVYYIYIVSFLVEE